LAKRDTMPAPRKDSSLHGELIRRAIDKYLKKRQ
jgi:hypothetical protein